MVIFTRFFFTRVYTTYTIRSVLNNLFNCLCSGQAHSYDYCHFYFEIVLHILCTKPFKRKTLIFLFHNCILVVSFKYFIGKQANNSHKLHKIRINRNILHKFQCVRCTYINDYNMNWALVEVFEHLKSKAFF